MGSRHAIAAGRNNDDKDQALQVFGVNKDSCILQCTSQSQANADEAWSNWDPREQTCASVPVVAVTPGSKDGWLGVLVRGKDDALHWIQQNPGGHWLAPKSLGGRLSGPPAVATTADGLEVFTRTFENELWRISLTAPNSWSAWSSMGKIGGDPVVAVQGEDQIAIFVHCSDDTIKWWKIADTRTDFVSIGNWSQSQLKITLKGNPVVFANTEEGLLEVFARGTDGGLWHTWQQPSLSDPTAWSPWVWLDVCITDDPCVVLDANKTLHVFATGLDHTLMHGQRDSTQPGSKWSMWSSLGGAITASPAAIANQDGRIEVFACGTDGVLSHIWQQPPLTYSGAWSDWEQIDPAPDRHIMPMLIISP